MERVGRKTYFPLVSKTFGGKAGKARQKETQQSFDLQDLDELRE